MTWFMALVLFIAFAIALGKAKQKSKRGIQITINAPPPAPAQAKARTASSVALSAPVVKYVFKADLFTDAETTIQSLSNPNETYLTNPNRQTCTCPDFVDIRSRYHLGDIRRLCKHLVITILNDPARHALQPHFATVLTGAHKSKKGVPLEEWKITRIGTRNVLLSANKQSDWYSVVAPDTDGPGYQRYCYNAVDNRWSYGRQPNNSDTIIDAITAGWSYK